MRGVALDDLARSIAASRGKNNLGILLNQGRSRCDFEQRSRLLRAVFPNRSFGNFFQSASFSLSPRKTKWDSLEQTDILNFRFQQFGNRTHQRDESILIFLSIVCRKRKIQNLISHKGRYVLFSQ
jgi:hypothetical protein